LSLAFDIDLVKVPVLVRVGTFGQRIWILDGFKVLCTALNEQSSDSESKFGTFCHDFAPGVSFRNTTPTHNWQNSSPTIPALLLTSNISFYPL